MSNTDSEGVDPGANAQRDPTNPQEPTSNTVGIDARVHYEPRSIDTKDSNVSRSEDTSSSTDAAGHTFVRSETSRSGAFGPVKRRLTGRVGTFKTIQDYEDFDTRPGWHPGSEPGVDPSKPDGGHASMPTLRAPCEITIVDFSPDKLSIRKFDNDTLEPFLNHPQPNWVKCRWINVNGLSWDVIQVLGRYKSLHKLAIEDLMNTRNRTKAEWFPTHAFIILTLQKLVNVYDTDDSDDDTDDTDADTFSHTSDDRRRAHRRARFFRRVRKLFAIGKASGTENISVETGESPLTGDPQVGTKPQPTGLSDLSTFNQLRTLQQYHSAPNDPRTLFMAKHSALSHRHLEVACEQVSMFITQDNTIISFFELSAQDVEAPIVRRLQTCDTIIRQSCDASMVGQAIIDAIIDLAIPVTACYSDVIGDLELDVLTRPTLNHTKSLYIVVTEINKMLSFINPIVTLINALRDHKTDLSQDAAVRQLQDPSRGVIITPMTYTYLGDVLDHSVLITESLNQLKDQAEGMIGLIFNTISAYQNESMKQLTIATIIFLPLTFLTGYFGQNFVPFDVLQYDIIYFWKIALPLVVAISVLLLREAIFDYTKAMLQRRYILRLRRDHWKRRKLKKS